MNEGLIWATYAIAAIPGCALRRWRRLRLRYVAVVGALTAALSWSLLALYTGSDTGDPWFGIGVMIAAQFGVIFGAVGASAAMWFEEE